MINFFVLFLIVSNFFFIWFVKLRILKLWLIIKLWDFCKLEILLFNIMKEISKNKMIIK